MLAFTEFFFAVVVLLLRVAPLFSWMTMVTMSPMEWAFLSANMDRGSAELSVQREPRPAEACEQGRPSSARATMGRLESNEYRLFIFYLSVQFTVCFGIADANCLARQAVFERFDLKINGQAAVLENAIHHAAAQDGGTDADGAVKKRRASGNRLGKFDAGIIGGKVSAGITEHQYIAALQGDGGVLEG